MSDPIRIVVTSHYARLSQGRHSARRGRGDATTWADQDAQGRLVIATAGTWQLHAADGYSRVARATLEVDEDGSWQLTGDTRRFAVTDESATAEAE